MVKLYGNAEPKKNKKNKQTLTLKCLPLIERGKSCRKTNKLNWIEKAITKNK